MRTGLVVDLQTGLPVFQNEVWQEFDGTITDGTTEVIDTLPLIDFNRIKYEITFTGATDDDSRSLTMSVQKKSSEIKEVVFGKTGNMNIQLATAINGASFELRATNSQGFDVEYCISVLTS